MMAAPVEGQKRPRLSGGFLFDEAFSSALNESKAKRILKETRAGLTTNVLHTLITLLEQEFKLDVQQPSCNIWPTMLGDIITSNILHVRTEFPDLYNIAMQALSIQEGHLHNRSDISLRQLFNRNVETWKRHHDHMPNVINSCLQVADELHTVMQECRGYYDENNISEIEIDTRQIKYKRVVLKSFRGASVIFLGNYSIISYGGFCEFHNTDYLRMMFAKALDLSSVILTAWLYSGVNYSDNFWEKIISIIDFSCRMFPRYGSDAYTILKSLEGFSDGLVLLREETWLNDELIQNVWDSLVENNLVDEAEFRNSEWYRLLNQFTTPELFEIGGISKLMGHPDIDVQLGLTKLYNRTRRDIPIDIDASIQLSNSLLYDYCKVHFAKHKRWPIMEILETAKPQFAYCVLHNKWLTNRSVVERFGRTVTADWVHVFMGHNRKFDYVDSVIPLLGDKALSLTRSNIYKKIAGETVKLKLSDRRVLLNFLFNEELPMPIREYLHKCASIHFTRDEEVLEYLVIKLTQKEKELKVEGRMFGQSPLIERLRRVILERGAAKLLSDYCPHQAMTLTELERLKRLCMFARLQNSYRGCAIVQISMDFEAWNNYFRHETMSPSWSALLDPWYNVDYYSNIMKGFENTFFYHTDDTKIYSWDGQEGGIEGLAQYSWETVFVGMITQVLHQLGYPFQMLSNGDDCRLAVAIPNIEMFNPAARIRQLKEELQAATYRFGLRLKVSETYSSEILIAFGKTYQVRASWMPSLLKKAAKIHGYGNTIIPFLDQRIASSYSNAHSTCGVGTVHNLIWASAAIWHLWHMSKTDHWAGMTRVQKMALLFWPSVLNGYSVLPLYHFYVRGESDLLSIYLSMYKYIARADIALFNVLRNILRIDINQREQSIRLLLTDPYALNRNGFENPIAKLRGVMAQFLSQYTKNIQLRQLFAYANDGNEEIVMRVLGSLDPYPSKVAAELWACTVYSLRSEIVMKFETARTIFQFLVSTGMKPRRAKNFYNSLIRKDQDILKKRLEVLRGASDKLANGNFFCNINIDELTDDNGCPTDIAQRARINSWRRDIFDITYPCNVDLVHMVNPMVTPLTQYDFENHFLLFVQTGESTYATQFRNSHYLLPVHRPFLGKTTSEKITHDFRLSDTFSPAASKINNLIRIHAHTKVIGSELNQIIRYLFEQMSNRSFAEIDGLVAAKLGGTITHRFAARSFKRTIMPNERPNRYSMVVGTSDTNALTRLKGGDFSINFMATYCQMVCSILSPMEYSGSIQSHSLSPIWYGVITSCVTCYRHVEDPVIRCPEVRLLYALPRIPRTPLLTLSPAEEQDVYQAMFNYAATRTDAYVHLTADDYRRPELIRQAQMLVVDTFIRNNQTENRFISMNPEINERNDFNLSVMMSIVHGHRESPVNVTELMAIQPDILFTGITNFLAPWLLERMSIRPLPDVEGLILSIPIGTLPLTTFFGLLIRFRRWEEMVRFIHQGSDLVANFSDMNDAINAQRFLMRYLLPILENYLETIDDRRLPPVLRDEHIMLTVNQDRDSAFEEVQHNMKRFVINCLNRVLPTEVTRTAVKLRSIFWQVHSILEHALITLERLSRMEFDEERNNARRMRNEEAQEIEDDHNLQFRGLNMLIRHAVDPEQREQLIAQLEVLNQHVPARILLVWPLRLQTYSCQACIQCGIIPDEVQTPNHAGELVVELRGLLELSNSGLLPDDRLIELYAWQFLNTGGTARGLTGLSYINEMLRLTDRDDIIDQLEAPDREFMLTPFTQLEVDDAQTEINQLVSQLIERRMRSRYLITTWTRLLQSQQVAAINVENPYLAGSVRMEIDEYQVSIIRIDWNTTISLVRSLNPTTTQDIQDQIEAVRRIDRIGAQLNMHERGLSAVRWMDPVSEVFEPPIRPEDLEYEGVPNEELEIMIHEINRQREIWDQNEAREPEVMDSSFRFRYSGLCDSDVSILMELLQSTNIIDLLRRVPEPILCAAGDRRGYVTRLLLQIIPNSEVVYNALLQPDDVVNMRDVPSELATVGDPELIRRCRFLANFSGFNDLSVVQCAQQIRSEIALTTERSCSLIISNVSRNGDPDQRQLLQLRCLWNIITVVSTYRTIIIMRLEMCPTQAIHNFLSCLWFFVTRSWFYKPACSPNFSTEYYLVLDAIISVDLPAFDNCIGICWTRSMNYRRWMNEFFNHIIDFQGETRLHTVLILPQQHNRLNMKRQESRQRHGQNALTTRNIFIGLNVSLELANRPIDADVINMIANRVRDLMISSSRILTHQHHEIEQALLNLPHDLPEYAGQGHRIQLARNVLQASATILILRSVDPREMPTLEGFWQRINGLREVYLGSVRGLLPNEFLMHNNEEHGNDLICHIGEAINENTEIINITLLFTTVMNQYLTFLGMHF